MERRVRWKSHARCGAGENLEITSKDYLSLFGQSDIPANKVRELIGEDKIVGVSARTIEEALTAKKNGADYLGVGAMFNTTTKLDAKSVSIEKLKGIKEVVKLPVVAIGGLSLSNIDKLRECNVDGYAVVSAILGASNIKLECEKWIEKIEY